MSCSNCSIFKDKCQAICCGPIPVYRTLLNAHFDKIQRPIIEVIEVNDEDVLPLTEDRKCPFLSESLECAIYEDRPSLCQMFGSGNHINLTCSYQKPDGSARTKKETKQIQNQQIQKANKTLNKLQHGRT